MKQICLADRRCQRCRHSSLRSASALAAALAHRSATQRGCGACSTRRVPFDVPEIAGAACPFVRGSTERKPGLHQLSAGGSRSNWWSHL